MKSYYQKPVHILRLRARRLARHLLVPFSDPYLDSLRKRHNVGLLLVHYIAEVPLLFLDLMGLPEIFGFCQGLLKKEARLLNESERNFAISIFGNSFDLRKARIDEYSKIGTHGGKYAFVSYYYINCQGSLSIPILIHELVHILQFEQVGTPYALRNMMAHLIPPTYNYGGLDKILSIVQNPTAVHQLNYEQRADVFSDYCLLLMGGRPEWGSANAIHLNEYNKVIELLL